MIKKKSEPLFCRFARKTGVRRPRIAAAVFAATSALVPATRALAISYDVWDPSVGGTYNWNNSGNWGGGAIPNSSGIGADLTEVTLTGDQSINVQNQTIAALLFGDDEHGQYQQTITSSSGQGLFMGSSGGTADIYPDGGTTISAIPQILAPVVMNNCNLLVESWVQTLPGDTNPNNPGRDATGLYGGFTGGVNLEVFHASLDIYDNGGAAVSWSGSTTLDGGYATLNIDDNNLLPATTALTLADTTDVLNIANEDQNVGSIAGDGTIELGFGQLQTNRNGSTFSGVITGTSTSQLIIAGGGTLTFAASSSSPGFAGTFVVNGANTAMAISNASAIGSGSITLENLANFETKATFSASNPISISSSGAFNVDSGTTFTASGQISGSGGIAVEGPGTLVLSGNNNFTGGVDLEDGTLSVSKDSNLGAAGYGLGFAGGLLATTGTFSSPRPITLFQSSDINVAGNTTLTLNGQIFDSGGSSALVNTGSGTLILGNGANGFHGLVLENGGIVKFSGDGNLGASGNTLEFFGAGGTLELLGGNNVSNSRPVTLFLGGSADFFVDAASTLTLDGSITTVAGDTGVSNFGGGTLVLGGNNSYSGGTTVGGNVSISSDANLGAAGTPITFSQTFSSVGIGHFVAGTLLTTGSFSTNRPVTLGSFGGTLDAAPGTAFAMNGVISGGSGINKVDTGTVVLTGANNFGGGTVVFGGTLAVRSNYTVPLSDPLGTGPVTLAGGTLYLLGTTFGPTQQALGVTGFNQDVIVEQNAINPQNNVTSGFDSTNNTTGEAFYEDGYVHNSTSGLPNNHTIVSATNPNVSFVLQSYTADNVLLLQNNQFGQLQLTNPQRFDTLSVLAAAANGAAATQVTLNFADGSSDSFSLNVSDWFTNTPGAFVANGRVGLANNSLDNIGSGFPRLYEYDYTLSPADADKTLTSVGFADTGGGALGIFALSGSGGTAALGQNYSNNVTVSSDSTINVGGSPVASMNSLTIGSNTLSVAGGINNSFNSPSNLGFNGGSINGNATFNVGFNTSLTLGGTVGGAGSITKTGSGTMVLSGTNNYNGGTFVNAGLLIVSPIIPTVNPLPVGPLSISGNGIAEIADNVSAGTRLGTSNIFLTSLSITGNGILDIGNNRIIIQYAPGNDPIASIAAWIKNGFYGLPGPSIISSDISADDAASGFSYGIGYADGADGLVAGLPSGEIELMYTLLGDANLDGTVNTEDFTPFSTHLGESGMTWDDGDFNYDGTVNTEDFTPFSHNLNQSAVYAAAAGGLDVANGISLANVPEPTAALMVGMVLAGALGRRRRGSVR